MSSKREQEEYTKEEINWSYIEFVDNQDVLDLIEKVFYCLLDGLCQFMSFLLMWRISFAWHNLFVSHTCYQLHYISSRPNFTFILFFWSIAFQLSSSIFCRNLEELLHFWMKPGKQLIISFYFSRHCF